MTDIDDKINALRREMQLITDSLEKSINVAKGELDRRLEAMNEFRAQLTSQNNTFMSRAEIELMSARLNDKIDSINKIVISGTGEKKWSDHIITVLIGIAVIIIIKLF